MCDTLPSDDRSKEVNFHSKDKDQFVEERKRMLTAKYNPNQMKLIRKRLEVEEWLYSELERLYNGDVTCDVDIDQLMDLDDDESRIALLKAKLTDCIVSSDELSQFIDAVLKKISAL